MEENNNCLPTFVSLSEKTPSSTLAGCKEKVDFYKFKEIKASTGLYLHHCKYLNRWFNLSTDIK